MHEFGGMSVPLAAFATLFFCCYLALFPAAAAWITRRMPVAARACAGVGVSRPRGRCWSGCASWMFTGFPWLGCGLLASAGRPACRAIAPLVGVYGVSLLAALSAGLLVWWAPWRSLRDTSRACATGCCIRRPSAAGCALAWRARPEAGSLDHARRRAGHRQSGAGEHQAGHEVAAGVGAAHAGDLSAARREQPTAGSSCCPKRHVPLFNVDVPLEYLDLLAAARAAQRRRHPAGDARVRATAIRSATTTA